MVKYINCYVGEDGKIHRGKKINNFYESVLAMIEPEYEPKIIFNKKEAKKLFGNDCKKGKYFIKSYEGIKILVEVI